LQFEQGELEHLTSAMERLQWRRDKVQELSSKGHSQREIAKILQIGLGSVNRDLTFIRQQAKNNIKKYIDERLPEEYEKCMVGLNSILREAWNTSEQTEDRREKIQALSLAKECYGMKLDLLTNATVVDDAIRFVSANSKEPITRTIADHETEFNNNRFNLVDGEQTEDKKTTTRNTNQVF
jgi:DNA-binding CsgD family transcriptional regulator